MNTDRFKFRVWDNNENKYLEYCNLTDCGNAFMIDCFESIHYCSDCIIEQCTGLRDKNRKLIYEGDVIENTLSNGIKPQWFIMWNKEELKHVRLNIPWFKQEKLELGKNFSMEKYIVFSSYWINMETASRYEIIGNIHDPKFGIEIPEGDSK